MRPNYPKLIFAVLAGLYFLSIAYDPIEGSLLDIVDLPIHETGHLIFRILGEFMGVAGGSLFQVILPAVFVGYFVFQRSFYSASIVLFWVGQSLLNVWIYAADAIKMQLVLTSGLTGSEGSFHDWNYLLDATGLLNSTNTVAGIIRFLGTIVIIAALIGSIYYSWPRELDESNSHNRGFEWDR
ncbi:MAG: hypothetical protein UZ17_ACD001000619 [Acidobacteria bacterium OLB17]|nr:MAG: hypothetical protein UZ17_ACD001000619 [Acidobacteria bacterium OLB17]MCZ2390588.1 hypothetical protein [Acidobacteriota bacterium]